MDRRNFLRASLGFVACAPAIVRASSIMQVRSFPLIIGVDPAGADMTAIMMARRDIIWPGIKLWWDETVWKGDVI